MDVKNDRIELWDANIVVDLEPVSKLRKRIRQRPQIVIDIYSGMSGARAVMEDLGYNIGHWFAVENNTRVAAAVPYSDVVHSRQADVMKHSTESLVAELGARPDWCFAGPNCQQFSSVNPGAKGMPSVGGDLFNHVCNIATELIGAYPRMKYCIENVVPKSKMREETLAKWNSLVPVDFAKLNAASVGAGTSRPRMVSTNMVSVPEIRKKPSADPNIFLQHNKLTAGPCHV